MSESVICDGKEVLHNTVPWRVATNRHPNTDGTRWGWIEGAPGHICWSDNESFNRVKAGEAVAAHNQWLEEQKPLTLRIVEATERATIALKKAESAQQEADKCKATLEVALAEVERLESMKEATS